MGGPTERVAEGGGESHREPAGRLRHHVHAGWQPRAGHPVERDDAVHDGGGRYRVEGVPQARPGEQGGLVRREGAVQRVDPPGNRLLRQQDERARRLGRPAHELRTADMSRTARTMPRGVPVTFERPCRGA